jgi:hypothetical protein
MVCWRIFILGVVDIKRSSGERNIIGGVVVCANTSVNIRSKRHIVGGYNHSYY